LKTKLCFLDIETFPIKARTWGPKWEANLLRIDEPIHLASFAWKFMGEDAVHCLGQCDTKNERELVQRLWDVFDVSQIIVAHNGKSFDIKQSNAFFIYHKLKPPTPAHVVDTKIEAKRYFKVHSNSLDELGQYFGVGEKVKTGGIDLWWGCEENDPKSWRLMKKYNKQDVLLLELVYRRMLPWMKFHPNLNVLEDSIRNCPNCGGSRIERRGHSITRTGTRQRFQCRDCGAWSSGKHEPSNVLIR
jgi:uncharacterized protein YprB with RNaseH-like and TPR domain/predicted RNA-binding Zn-ribbon protein involved in translation (DUF1610 family)